MSIPQFRHNRNRVQTGIFGQRGRNDLQRLGECLEAVRFFALEGLSMLREESREVDFGCATTHYQGPFVVSP